MEISELIAWHKLCHPDSAGIENEPNPKSFQALEGLMCNLINNLVMEFTKPIVTYGFTSFELLRFLTQHHPGHMAPALDQHAAHELNTKGNRICKRDGAACDLFWPDSSMQKVASFVVDFLPFDRLYYYGDRRPIHLSYGPEHTRQVVWMNEIQGRRIPKVIDAKTLRTIAC